MTRKTERSRRGLAPARPETLETRAMLTLAATAPLPDVAVAAPRASVAAVNLDNYFKDSAPVANSYAVVNTSLGSIPVQLTPQATPKTVANFLSYATSGAYNNTIVHRSVPGFIWQTGGYQVTGGGQVTPIAQGSPVVNEPGQSNVRGTIAMAKLGGDPNSATDQFFFNESDSNASNLDNQNGGFTVFGHVVGSQGLAVMDAVGNVPIPSSSPLQSPLDSAPLINYSSGAVQASNFVTISGVTPASDVFQATSDAPTTVAVSVQNDTLAISPLATGTAHVTVTGFGSDGQPVSSTFAVTVGGTAPSGITTTATPTATATPVIHSTTSGTPAQTTTTATTATPPPAASVLTPAIKGTLPAAATAGRSTKIPLSITLTNPATGKAVSQKERISLGIYRLEGTARPIIPVATVTKAVKLQPGQHTQVNLAQIKVPKGTAPDTYGFVYTITDPGGATTTLATTKSIRINPGAS